MSVFGKVARMLGIVNDDVKKGPRRLRAVWPAPTPIHPQGRRERLRRIKHIVHGVIPFSQLGGRDPLLERQIAQKNYLESMGMHAPGGRMAA